MILGLDAMRTRFELVLLGAEPAFLSAAGHEALEEIRAAEAQLSIFRRDSWLSRLNADAAIGAQSRTAVLVPAQLYALLECCQQVNRATQGAFDPSVGPLLDAHGLRDEAPSWELAEESLSALRASSCSVKDACVFNTRTCASTLAALARAGRWTAQQRSFAMQEYQPRCCTEALPRC